MARVPAPSSPPALTPPAVTLPDRVGPARQVLDRLVGARLQASIARRVRRELRRQHDSWTGALAGLVAEEVQRQLATAALDRRPGNAEFTLDVLLGAGSRYDRTLTPARWAALAEELTGLTGVADPRLAMGLAYRTLLDQETRGLGRIAGGPYNIVGKLTAPVLLAPPEGPVLEIGTLFGLFSPALIKHFRRVGRFRSLTVIDPLAGNQLQPDHAFGTDPSGTPVNAVTAQHNFALGRLEPDEVRLVEGFSTDPDVQQRAADRAYAVVVVDGDHSEDGVYADLRWVETVVAPGGIVVVDDYGDVKWPGVERATQRYLADGGRLELLGRAATSAYLRMP